MERLRLWIMALLAGCARTLLTFWDRWMPVRLMLGVDVTDTFYSGEAFIGYGYEFQVGQDDGSPETYASVADVNIITPGGTPAGIINKTHLRSPGRTHEKLSTIRDLEPWNLAGNYRPTHGSHKLAGGDGFASPSASPAIGDDGKSLAALHRSQRENNFRVKGLDAQGNEVLVLLRAVVSNYKIGGFVLDQKVDFTATLQPLHDWTDGLP